MGLNFLRPPDEVIPLVDKEGRATTIWWEWFRQVVRLFQIGATTTIPLAAITGGGTPGSITIKQGVIVGYIAPT